MNKPSKTPFLFLWILMMAFFTLLISKSYGAEFKFSFKYEDKKWDRAVSAETWTAALDRASQECLNYFTGAKNSEKIKVTPAVAENLLNSCTNPR